MTYGELFETIKVTLPVESVEIHTDSAPVICMDPKCSRKHLPLKDVWNEEYRPENHQA